MPTIVIPYRGDAKRRLSSPLRAAAALAMLGDVVEAAGAIGEVRVVTDDVDAADLARESGAAIVVDPGDGQGAAVAAAVEGMDGAGLVVNADLPLATPASLAVLAAAGDALVAARDGTTNALSLTRASRFVPLYGAGSAARFAELGLVRVSILELEADVDTIDDLTALALPVGRRTTLVLNHHKLFRTPA